MYDLIVIGGGPAGLAAACAAWDRGLRKILVMERDRELGGILNQCIHNGFGLHRFQEELTGPEYAGRYIAMLRNTGVEIATDTMALELTTRREVHVVSREKGYRILRGKTVVLAMGCRERTRGAISIPGTRPAGIFTAGAAQRYMNIEGYMVGRRVVIVGSGDIGLIMARRMTLEGAEVLACVEIQPYPGGLNRNIVQCLHDFHIPLHLSHTVTDIRGEKRLEGVTVARVDAARRPVSGTEMELCCDTLLLSVGLIPENELSSGAGVRLDARTGGPVVCENMETAVPGIFACGNAVHVNDMVDYVSAEGERAGAAAAAWLLGEKQAGERQVEVVNGAGIGYTVPQRIHWGAGEDIDLFFRVKCIYGDCTVRITAGGEQLKAFKRTRLVPGEMARVTLPGALLGSVGERLEISVEEAV